MEMGRNGSVLTGKGGEVGMTKVFCDRCGMEIPKKDGLDVYAWITHRCYYGSLRMVSSNNEPKIQEDNKYICPECEESYIHWFMNPAPKGGEVV